MIGRALSMIGAYNDLNNKEQVVALIDEVCATSWNIGILRLLKQRLVYEKLFISELMLEYFWLMMPL